MNKFLVGAVSTVIVCGPAFAWSHANRYGGGTYHAPGSGSTTRTDAAGGSETHTYGQGTTATNRYGGSATHTYGEGTTATSAYGGTATHVEGSGQTHMTSAYGTSATHYAGYGTTVNGSSYDHYYGGAYGAAYHPPTAAYYGAYHPPVTVNTYGSSCYNCGGWAAAGAAAAGAAVGVAAGAAIASANTSAATANAYPAGVAAGAAAATYSMGEIVSTLPAGCASPSVQGNTYYLCGNTWFSPSYGANGVYYRVITAP